LRGKRPQLRMALEGRVQEHQRFLFGMILEHIEYLERLVHRVEVEIEAQLSQYEEAMQLLLTLPASGRISAAMILGEIGTDMPRFLQHYGATRYHLAHSKHRHIDGVSAWRSGLSGLRCGTRPESQGVLYEYPY
jgi:transposase